MKKPVEYIQCQMRNVALPSQYTTGWIEARGARVGVVVDLLPDREQWEVLEVYGGVAVDHDKIKDMESNYRAGLPSTRDTAKDKRKKDES